MSLLAAPALADPQCTQTPAAVENYLRAHKDWSIVTQSALSEFDRKIWVENRKDLCPGFADADLDGRRSRSYGIALLGHEEGKLFEKLVLLSPDKRGFKEETLMKSAVEVGAPAVVWRAGPGRYFDYKINGNFSVMHDTINYEHIAASSTAYYRVNGKLRTALTSD